MSSRPEALWDEARADFVAGRVTFEAIAERLGVSYKTVVTRAGRGARRKGGRSWLEMRTAYQRDRLENQAALLAKAAEVVAEQVAQDAAAVALELRRDAIRTYRYFRDRMDETHDPATVRLVVNDLEPWVAKRFGLDVVAPNDSAIVRGADALLEGLDRDELVEIARRLAPPSE